MKTNEQINEEIAILLGFTKYGITVNGVKNADFGWSYPYDFKYMVSSTPMRHIPDFLGIMQQHKKVKEILSHSVLQF